MSGSAPASQPGFLTGGGAVGALLRAMDWSGSALGPPADWPQSLRSSLSICLNSPMVSAIYWGPDFRMLYNDAYAPVLAERHPAALGQPLNEVWSEIRDVLGPQLQAVVDTGVGFAIQNQPLVMNRGGLTEETFWTYSFTPIQGEDDAIVGVFLSALENTEQVRAQRAEAAERGRLEEMFRQAPGFMALFNGPEHRFALVNDAYMTLIGEREVLGKTVVEAVPEAVEQGYLTLLDQVYRSGEPFAASEARFAPAPIEGQSTEEHIVDFVFQPVTGDNGEITGVFLQGSDVTARTRTEAELRRSEAFRRLLLDSTSEAFYSVDTDGATTLCNKAFLEMLGFDSVEEVLGRHLHDVIHHSHPDGSPYDRADCKIYRAASLGEASLVDDELFYRKDGTPVPVEYRAEPVIRDGVLEGAICTFVDISNRLAAEAALRQSEALLQTIAQAMPNHVWTSQPDGHLDWFNGRVYEYSGLSEAELLGHGWTRMVHDQDLPDAAENWAKALGSGEVYEAEFRLQNRNGEFRWHIARAMPVRDPDGSISRWIGTNTDIQDQKSAAETLANQNENLEQLAARRTAERDRLWRNAQDLLVVTEPDGVLVSVNDAWTYHLGWSEAQLVGRNFAEFTHPDDLKATVAAFSNILARPLVDPFEYRLRGTDGEYRWFSWTGAFEADRIYANGRNTTAEREQARSLADAQEALRQSQKMEAVGQLTGGIAHDFNNMLAIVIGNLDIASRRIQRGDAAIASYLDNAHDGASRAAVLTQRLLAFSRQSPLSPTVININSLVVDISELLHRTLGETVDFETVLTDGLWSSHVDANQLENAILNLAVNARDAMPEGGRLTLETANFNLDERYAASEPGLVAGQYVMIAVTDAGVGMDAETLKKVFDPFFTTKPVGKGTGLGLSMVYGFARQSGGHVRIYSEPGLGTTIKLYLPRHAGTAEQSQKAARPTSLPGAAPDGEVVLVVEDDDRVRAMSCAVLSELGYTIHTATGGEEALQIFDQIERVDILFTDIVMAGMSGRQLADRLRQDHPKLRVLYTTGYTRDAAVHSGVLEEGVAFLPKPFSVEDLAVKLRTVLDS